MRRDDPTHRWRGGRVAEGGGLLNRYTVNPVSWVRIPSPPPPLRLCSFAADRKHKRIHASGERAALAPDRAQLLLQLEKSRIVCLWIVDLADRRAGPDSGAGVRYRAGGHPIDRCPDHRNASID